jgi:hypothetical protein
LIRLEERSKREKHDAELRALREEARTIEGERATAEKSYASLSGKEQHTIIKCLFMLRGETGFSEFKGKEEQAMYLGSLVDVGALLRADAADLTPETAGEVEAPRAARAIVLDAEAQTKLGECDRQVLELMKQRRLIMRAGGAVPPATSVEAPTTPVVDSG